MDSILVKAILKGEDKNPAYLYNALMDDMIIKYSVEELLGNGLEVIEDKTKDLSLTRRLTTTSSADAEKLRELTTQYSKEAKTVMPKLLEAIREIPKYMPILNEKTKKLEVPDISEEERSRELRKVIGSLGRLKKSREELERYTREVKDKYHDFVFGKYVYRPYDFSYQEEVDAPEGINRKKIYRQPISIKTITNNKASLNNMIAELEEFNDLIKSKGGIEEYIKSLAPDISKLIEAVDAYNLKKDKLTSLIRKINSMIASFRPKKVEESISVKQYLGFLQQTVRSSRALEAEVKSLVGSELEGVPSEVLTDSTYERIKDKLLEFYTPTDMTQDELEILLLFAVFKPKEFKNMIKGVYAQTIKQLQGIVAMDKSNKRLVDTMTGIIKLLEKERQKVFSTINEVIRETNKKKKKKTDVKADEANTTLAVLKSLTRLTKLLAEIDSIENKAKQYRSLLKGNSAVKVQLLDKSLSLSEGKFRAYLRKNYVKSGKWIPFSYNSTVDEHKQIMKFGKEVADALYREDAKDKIKDILRYAYDSNPSLRGFISPKHITTANRRSTPQLRKMRRRLLNIKNLEDDLVDIYVNYIDNQEAEIPREIYDEFISMERDIPKRYDNAIAFAERERKKLKNLVEKPKAKLESEGKDIQEEFARDRTEEEEKTYQSITELIKTMEKGKADFQEQYKNLEGAIISARERVEGLGEEEE